MPPLKRGVNRAMSKLSLMTELQQKKAEVHMHGHMTNLGYNPPVLKAKPILHKDLEEEEVPRKLHCCCTFDYPRVKIEGYEHDPPGHDWFGIFYGEEDLLY